LKTRLATTLVDLPILAITLLTAGWLATHTDAQIETAMGLVWTQSTFDSDIWNREPMDVMWDSPGPPPLREKFAEKWPGSPIAKVNQISVIEDWERAINYRFGRGLAALAVAGVGCGVVAVRRPSSPRRRARWTPGRVAALVGLTASTGWLALEFWLRKSTVNSPGTLNSVWATNARTIGVAILAAWLLMAVSGRWRLGAGWRERLGLLLGGLWLFMLAWLVVLKPLVQL